MRTKQILALAGLGFALGLGGCSSEEAAAKARDEGPAVGGPATLSPTQTTGGIVEVKMVMDGAANYFEPQHITVSRGDVVRFVLVSGVHNASFPAASNVGASQLPRGVPYLQSPGQTHDLVVEVPAGEYTFQCDPHVALGMVGKMTVR